MNSRVHPNYKTKYRVTNWSEYDQALTQRGNITVWFSQKADRGLEREAFGKPSGSLREAFGKPSGSLREAFGKPSGSRGAPHKYSDLAIETALALCLVFRLPLR